MSEEKKVDRVLVYLTGRPPVSIVPEEWATVGHASDRAFDGETEANSDRVSNWSIEVLHRESQISTLGSYIVTAEYSYGDRLKIFRPREIKCGVYSHNLYNTTPDKIEPLDPFPAVCMLITGVCRDMAEFEHQGDDAKRWEDLIAACIRSLPAKEI